MERGGRAAGAQGDAPAEKIIWAISAWVSSASWVPREDQCQAFSGGDSDPRYFARPRAAAARQNAARLRRRESVEGDARRPAGAAGGSGAWGRAASPARLFGGGGRRTLGLQSSASSADAMLRGRVLVGGRRRLL